MLRRCRLTRRHAESLPGRARSRVVRPLSPRHRRREPARRPRARGPDVAAPQLPHHHARRAGRRAGRDRRVADGLAGAARLGGGALADDPERRRATAVGGYTATAVLSGAHRRRDARLAGRRAAGRRVGGPWAARAGPQRPAGRRRAGRRLRPGLRLRAGDGQPRRDRRPAARARPGGAVGVRTAILLSIIPGLLAAAGDRLRDPAHRRGLERARAPADPPAGPPGAARPPRAADRWPSAPSSSATSPPRC